MKMDILHGFIRRMPVNKSGRSNKISYYSIERHLLVKKYA